VRAPSESPRRIDTLRWTHAERAIQNAVNIVESMGADVRLTDAVILLGRARGRVADFVDGVPNGEEYPRMSASDEPREGAHCANCLRSWSRCDCSRPHRVLGEAPPEPEPVWPEPGAPAPHKRPPLGPFREPREPQAIDYDKASGKWPTRKISADEEKQFNLHFTVLRARDQITPENAPVLATVLAEVARLEAEPRGYEGPRGDVTAYSMEILRAASCIRRAMQIDAGKR
jgi:hypothetical protein